MQKPKSNQVIGYGPTTISMSISALRMSVKVSVQYKCHIGDTYSITAQTDVHNKMENTTSRLAVCVHKYPPFPFQWNDKSPQMSRCDLEEKDVLPTEGDGDCLRDHMLKFIMSFIVKELKSLSHLAHFIPSHSVPPARKSEVLPLKLLFRDEKSIDENIHILV